MSSQTTAQIRERISYLHATMAEVMRCSVCTDAMAQALLNEPARPIVFTPMAGTFRLRVVLSRLALYIGVPLLFWAPLITWLIWSRGAL